MILQKISKLFVLAAVPAIAGLFFILQTDMGMDKDKDKQKIPLPPGIITPGEQGSGQLSIEPAEKDRTKIEYRNILFFQDKDQMSFKVMPKSPDSAGTVASEKSGIDQASGSFHGRVIIVADLEDQNCGCETSQGIEPGTYPRGNIDMDAYTGATYPRHGPVDLDNVFQDDWPMSHRLWL